MSDEEYDVEWGSDNDYENNGGDGENSITIDIENNFYEAEGEMKEEPAQALEKFENVIELEESHEKFQYSFSSVKYVVILSAQLGKYDKMTSSLRQLLQLSPKASQNEMTEAVNAVLDLVETHLAEKPDQARDMYKLILGHLKSSNVRLWFQTSLRLGNIYLEENSFDQLDEVITELKTSCKDPDATSTNPNDYAMYDKSKGSDLMGVFAIEIQMCTERKEQRRMKDVFLLSQKFTSGFEVPRVQGIIKECGGKMYMGEKRWDMALQQFNESFRIFVECGHIRARILLKYVILVALLSNSDVDFTESNEAKSFVNDPEIIAMKSLKEGFDKNDIKAIQKVLADTKVNLLADPFINTYLEDLLRGTRLKGLLALSKPYKVVKLDFLAASMNVDAVEIRSLLSELILEEKLKGKIDQVNGLLELSTSEQRMGEKHRAMQEWGATLLDLHKQLTQKVAVGASQSEDFFSF